MTKRQTIQRESLSEAAAEVPTLIDELESSNEGTQEMAAARFAVEVTASFTRALRKSAASRRTCVMLSISVLGR